MSITEPPRAGPSQPDARPARVVSGSTMAVGSAAAQGQSDPDRKVIA